MISTSVSVNTLMSWSGDATSGMRGSSSALVVLVRVAICSGHTGKGISVLALSPGIIRVPSKRLLKPPGCFLMGVQSPGERERERGGERETDRQTERDRERDTERET